MRATNDERTIPAESLRPVDKLLHKSPSPRVKIGLGGEVVLLVRVLNDVEQAHLAGLAEPDVLTSLVDALTGSC